MAQGRARDRWLRCAGILLAAGVVGSVALTPVATAGASTAGDVSAAEAGTIQQSDVPSDFAETTPMKSQAGAPPTEPDTSDDFAAVVADVPECKAFVKVFQPTSKSVTASADGASFDKSETLGGASLSSSTLIFKSTGDAKKFFVPMKAPKLPTCLDKAMKVSIEQSMAAGGDSEGMFSKFDSSISKRAVPKVGDEVVDYRIEFEIGTDASSGFAMTLNMYMDMEFVRDGRSIGAYLSMSTGTPDEAAQQSAVSAAVARLSDALS